MTECGHERRRSASRWHAVTTLVKVVVLSVCPYYLTLRPRFPQRPLCTLVVTSTVHVHALIHKLRSERLILSSDGVFHCHYTGIIHVLLCVLQWPTEKTHHFLSQTHTHTQSLALTACSNNSVSPKKNTFLINGGNIPELGWDRAPHMIVAPSLKACVRLISLCWWCLLPPHTCFKLSLKLTCACVCVWGQSDAFPYVCCFTSWSHSICGVFPWNK